MSDMLRQNPHLRLMGALHFSASDVAANSRGELSGDTTKGTATGAHRSSGALDCIDGLRCG